MTPIIIPIESGPPGPSTLADLYGMAFVGVIMIPVGIMFLIMAAGMFNSFWRSKSRDIGDYMLALFAVLTVAPLGLFCLSILPIAIVGIAYWK